MGFVGLVYLMQMAEQEMSNRFSSGEASIENIMLEVVPRHTPRPLVTT